MSVKVLNPSSPLCFSTHVSGCFIISMTPWRICSVFRSTLQSIFCIIRVFQHVRPAGLFRAAPGGFVPCSVGGSFLSIVCCLGFLLLLLAVPVLLWYWFSFFFHSFDLLSPSFSFHASLPHARTLCQLWYNVRISISFTFTPPPLYNGGTFAKSISVWRLDFVHETDSYTNLSDSVCCVQLLFLDSFIESRNWAL